MYKEKGLYVFPTEKDCYRIFTFDGYTMAELESTTYAKQIIDFTQMNMKVIENIVMNSRALDFYADGSYDYERINKLIQGNYYLVAKKFCPYNPVYSFLLCNEMEEEIQGTYITNNYELDNLFDKSVSILENLLFLHSTIFIYAQIYCQTEGTHEEKIRKTTQNCTYLEHKSFTQIFSTYHLDEHIFRSPTHEYPFQKGFHFVTLEEYMWFVFFSFLNYDVNFSQCVYCGQFFIPATKKKTRYCNRLRTKDSKLCKEIGPHFMRKMLRENNTLLNEYDKAVARNYKRLERTENQTPDHHTKKELDIMKYTKWLNNVQQKKSDWLSKTISDDDFSKAIHELD